MARRQIFNGHIGGHSTRDGSIALFIKDIGNMDRSEHTSIILLARQRLMVKGHCFDNHFVQSPDTEQIGADIGMCRTEHLSFGFEHRSPILLDQAKDLPISVGKVRVQYEQSDVVEESRHKRVLYGQRACTLGFGNGASADSGGQAMPPQLFQWNRQWPRLRTLLK